MLVTFLAAVCLNPHTYYITTPRSDLPFRELVSAVIWVESANNPKALSSAGAKGLMQMTDIAYTELRTAMDVQPICRPPLTLDPYDARTSVHYGSCYLDLMLSRHNDDVVQALIAYNAGSSWVGRWADGRKLPTETYNYILRVTQYMEKYRCPRR